MEEHVSQLAKNSYTVTRTSSKAQPWFDGLVKRHDTAKKRIPDTNTTHKKATHAAVPRSPAIGQEDELDSDQIGTDLSRSDRREWPRS